MNQASLSWSSREKAQAVAVGLAPAFVVALLAIAAAFTFGSEAPLIAFLGLPLAYGTLFVSVLPALAFLRRRGFETCAKFVLATSAATFAPWAALAMAWNIAVPVQDAVPIDVLSVALLAPTAATALVSGVVWHWAFRPLSHAA